MCSKNVYIVAGSNGSGKTTFADTFLPEYIQCPQFINADLIAKGLSPYDPQRAAIKAGKLVIEQIQELMRQGNSFAFETTLSGKMYQKHCRELKKAGYNLHLFYLWIPSSLLALSRIKTRVAAGGHNVLDQDVRRRFERSLNNFFKIYRPLLTSWMLFDNSGLQPRLIAKEEQQKIFVQDQKLFTKITKHIGIAL